MITPERFDTYARRLSRVVDGRVPISLTGTWSAGATPKSLRGYFGGSFRLTTALGGRMMISAARPTPWSLKFDGGGTGDGILVPGAQYAEGLREFGRLATFVYPKRAPSRTTMRKVGSRLRKRGQCGLFEAALACVCSETTTEEGAARAPSAYRPSRERGTSGAQARHTVRSVARSAASPEAPHGRVAGCGSRQAASGGIRTYACMRNTHGARNACSHCLEFQQREEVGRAWQRKETRCSQQHASHQKNERQKLRHVYSCRPRDGANRHLRHLRRLLLLRRRHHHHRRRRLHLHLHLHHRHRLQPRMVQQQARVTH